MWCCEIWHGVPLEITTRRQCKVVAVKVLSGCGAQEMIVKRLEQSIYLTARQQIAAWAAIAWRRCCALWSGPSNARTCIDVYPWKACGKGLLQALCLSRIRSMTPSFETRSVEFRVLTWAYVFFLSYCAGKPDVGLFTSDNKKKKGAHL